MPERSAELRWRRIRRRGSGDLRVLTAWLLSGQTRSLDDSEWRFSGIGGDHGAGCAFVSIPSSLIIGLIAGFLVVVAVLFFDKIKIDDPVGATSVHLVCGVFGTLCVGLFAQDHFTPNTTGNGSFSVAELGFS